MFDWNKPVHEIKIGIHNWKLTINSLNYVPEININLNKKNETEIKKKPVHELLIEKSKHGNINNVN